MKNIFFIFILLSLNQFSVNGQEVVRHRYSAENIKITEYNNADTLKVLMNQFDDDNYCYYLSKNDDNDKFDVNIKLKIASYTTQWMTSTDEDGTKNFLRDTFNVEYIDNKAFIISPDWERKYLVYKFYAYKENESRFFIYWSREFGIILIKYLDHNAFTRNELLNEESKNKIILQLVLLTLGDTKFTTETEKKK